MGSRLPGTDDPHRGFKKGDLKFTLHGEKLHGSWVLVRMRGDRCGGKRTNWLLIKHRDQFAREGGANNILEAGSTRWPRAALMDEIAVGKGKAPTPFMPGVKTAAGRRVWGNRPGMREGARRSRNRCDGPRRRPPRRKRERQVEESRRHAAFRRAAALQTRRASATGRLGHEVKFDGYRVQMRVEDGDGYAAKPARASTGADKFAAHRAGQSRCPMR